MLEFFQDNYSMLSEHWCANVLKRSCVLCIAAIYRERSGGENEWGSAEVFLDGAAESHQEGNTSFR
jgi:hypothetical protein